MHLFLKNLKNYKLNRGMTYVELIVVLSIFSIMSTLIIFNYRAFQAKVDIKNLANDIALKIVEAQKASIFGKFPSSGPPSPTWKPSYGLYINPGSDNKSFVYFVDLNNNSLYEGPDCIGECVDKINITKNNFIDSLDVFYLDPTPTHSIIDLTLSFKRPDSTAVFKSSSALSPNISHIQITVTSPELIQAVVELHASGRIQIK